MPDEFKSWRRMLGVMTLVLALVFTGAWVRSLLVEDEIQIQQSRSVLVIRSINGSMWWLWQCESFNSEPFARYTSPARIAFDEFSGQWGLRATLCGKKRGSTFFFGSGELSGSGPASPKLELWVVPYWPFVFPLTLISVLLLLSRPRARKSGPAVVCQNTE